jgi:hypothetical protein
MVHASYDVVDLTTNEMIVGESEPMRALRISSS